MATLRDQIEMRAANRRNPCYWSSPQSPSLSISSSEEKSWSFPWRLFSYARYEIQSERHLILIAIAGYEIHIEGWNLEALAEEVGVGKLSKIKALPPEYREPTDSKPYVYKIEVKEVGRGS